MTIGIVGLGLIGGSFARAYKEAGWEVLAFDTDRQALEFARLAGAVDGELLPKELSRCQLVLICVYPEAAVEYLRQNGGLIGPGPLVMDCCGTKRRVCEACFILAERHGFTYMGSHPMAGTHNSGFKYSRANMFKGAPMVLVPRDFDSIELLDRAKKLLAPAGFGRFSVTTAREHDEMIAFTSQLAHVASNAYIKSPTARRHRGFSAGSYKDMTRVAWLNPEMWAELFLENSDCLISELDTYIQNLAQYRKAMENGDRELLVRLLDEGRRLKEEVDGR